jgi:cell wall-associated NlpC family hydrolase
MRDFAPDDEGNLEFRPDTLIRRKHFARAVVRAFAPGELPDGSLAFSDLSAEEKWYRWAAVAVSHRWMTAPDGAFSPDDPVTTAMAHRALVLALGLGDAAAGLDALHTRDGVTFDMPANFGTTLLGMRLYLRYNFPSGQESMDVAPKDPLTRAHAAYSLYRAWNAPGWLLDDLTEQYTRVRLPHLGPRMREIVQWGIDYVGYPYVWGGEWGFERPEPTALGGQPRSGFDCSGITWWALRADDDVYWDINPPRPYRGWSLPQRSSADMAANTTTRIKWDELQPGDLMFYDGNGDRVVDHVDTYVGNGFALDSSSTPGGVTFMWVGDGWYADHFRFGRRILP